MSHEKYSPDFYKGPAFALVIGITTYKYGVAAGKVPGPDQILNLEFAAKDARDFATFLQNNGFISNNVQSLIDDEATLPKIKGGFETLLNDCEAAGTNKPLVIVYFAGHGMADERDRHYLLPWEAERNNLAATALSKLDLNARLDALKTNRLVVFLDACHSGGMGVPGARGGVMEYDAERYLGEGTGRWVIASCKKGQRSWEADGNGIFTGQLLALLKGDTEDFDEMQKVEIDTIMLFDALRKRVLRIAHEKYQQAQEPIIVEARDTTGIVLAINQRAKRYRLETERQKNEKLTTFLDAVCDALRETNYEFKSVGIVDLRGHILKGTSKGPGFELFYGAFREYANLEDALQRLPVILETLISAHKEAMDSPRAASKPLKSEPQPAVGDFVDARENKVLGSEKRATSQSAPPVPGREQRLFSDEAQKHILGEIMVELKYYTQARGLSSCLAQPVSESDFADVVHRVTPKDDTDPLHGILNNIVTRFREKWPEAQIAKSDAPQNARHVKLAERLMDKNKDA